MIIINYNSNTNYNIMNKMNNNYINNKLCNFKYCSRDFHILKITKKNISNTYEQHIKTMLEIL